MSNLEIEFLSLWQDCHPNLSLERELKLIPKRKYRFDFGHLPSKVAIEINGGTWHKGGHSSGTGLMRDYEKLNLAQSEGWLVYQLAGKMITQDWLDVIATTMRDRSCLVTHT